MAASKGARVMVSDLNADGGEQVAADSGLGGSLAWRGTVDQLGM